ncbi:MAG: hypothetical protein JW749_04725 [Sedimentisphaerales bacterium]|nr:hypothetical protein [Sedimentisphaerales bacterium]
MDFFDFALFADSWPTTYDIWDLSGFAFDWLKTESVYPELTLVFDQDPNNIHGYVNVTVDSNEEIMGKVFLFMDGQLRATTDVPTEWPMVVNSMCDSNGLHSFNIVGVDEDGNIICSQPIDVSFNNHLSYFIAENGFRPSLDYTLYGIGSGNYTVELYDNYTESVVYSDTFEDSINAHISSYTFVPISDSNGFAYAPYTLTVSDAYDEIVKIILHRKFNKADYPPDSPARMLVSCGNEDVEQAKMRCIVAVLTAAVKKKIWPIYLNNEDCSFENVQYCLNLNNVKKWYHVSHGAYDLIGQPPRQCVDFKDGLVFSRLRKDYDPNNIPPDYEPLSWYYENNHSIRELGLYGNPKLNWVQFNCCYSGHTDEFPISLGMPIEDPTYIGKVIFIGWREPALVYDIIGKYNQFEEKLWEHLAMGFNLQDAFDFATSGPGWNQIENNFITYGVISWQLVWFRDLYIN